MPSRFRRQQNVKEQIGAHLREGAPVAGRDDFRIRAVPATGYRRHPALFGEFAVCALVGAAGTGPVFLDLAGHLIDPVEHRSHLYCRTAHQQLTHAGTHVADRDVPVGSGIGVPFPERPGIHVGGLLVQHLPELTGRALLAQGDGPVIERGPPARIQREAGFDDLFRVPQGEAALLEGGERDGAVIVDLFGHREPRPGLGRAGVQRDAGLRGERAPRVLTRTRPRKRRGRLRVGEPAEAGEEVHDVALDHRRRPPRIGELIEHGASLDGLLGREPPQLVFELVLGHALILS